MGASFSLSGRPVPWAIEPCAGAKASGRTSRSAYSCGGAVPEFPAKVIPPGATIRRPLIRTTAHCTQVGFGVKKSWDDPEVSVQQLELLGRPSAARGLRAGQVHPPGD